MQATQEFITAARPSTVWRILADVEHWPDWTPTALEIKPLGSSGLMVGARYRVVQPKLRPAVYEVTECVPNKTFTWVQKLPGGTMAADHRLSPHGDATRVELSFTSKGPLANLICTMLSRVIGDYVATEVRSLKSRCDRLAVQGGGSSPEQTRT
ncbi:MAG: SRPBCC family protein [Candidatus Acidiferrales bacterium]